MNPYSCLIARLNGAEIGERFDYYLGLVRKGVSGFIVFGGELGAVRQGIDRLQKASLHKLIISSDLEQGLGQQIKGGTTFPPAMAVASALSALPRDQAALFLRKLYTAFALEARHAGINTIFAPVLDINRNPENPIIATRSFGEDPETVSFFGCEMITVLQESGIIACGKHFPGHGDTAIDSHISLPVLKKGISLLEDVELEPFRRTIREGVKMIMLGHLSVPAMDPSGKPATISAEIISYLRTKLNFSGIVISDAMNMGALAGYEENEASLMALNAGVDIILHPSDPDRTASYLAAKKWGPKPLSLLITPAAEDGNKPDFTEHRALSDELARMAITVEREPGPDISKPFIVLLKEDDRQRGAFFIDSMKERYGDFGYIEIANGDCIPWDRIHKERDIIVAIFSQVRAWKGGTGAWLLDALSALAERAKIFISFGNPYPLRTLKNVTKIYAYWDSEAAQKAVQKKLTVEETL